MTTAIAIALLLGACLSLGTAFVLSNRDLNPSPADYLRSLDENGEVELDEYQQKLTEPLVNRVLKPLGGGVGHTIGSVTPRAQLDRIHAQLLQAGLAGTMRAEEFATLVVVTTGAGFVLGFGVSILFQPRLALLVCAIVGLPVIGLLLPQAWLSRKVTERKDALRRDLPDVLDLMAISVEAGTGFEGAMSVVCAQFHTPLSEELSRSLKEMELGLTRRQALQNLRRRTEVPELSNFILALVQADALGMPIGRVLKTQAVEMRNKRRQWAREKAAKLPVKIMIPLVLFIFPAILVVLLYPAFVSIVHGLK
jgi:tight adherence protein C